MKLLLYCTKGKPILSEVEYFYGDEDRTGYECIPNTKKGNKYLEQMGLGEVLNGKIVAECDFEVEWYDTSWYCNDFIEHNGLEKSCLTKEQLFDYVKGRNEFYAIHIKNLHIFDKPYELGKALIYNFNTQYIVEKAPQNMMKVYNRAGECHILISIKPQWMCKILNGEKTIEVRRNVLKEMK